MNKALLSAIVAALLAILPVRVSAQSTVAYEHVSSIVEQKEILSYIADAMTEGRASGTQGKLIAERFIVDKFKEYGLKPYEWNYTQSFSYKDSLAVRNVVGVLPSNCGSDEYIVIGAHYDHLGRLGHSVYCGADDNASGVTVLLSLAKMFSCMRADGRGPRKNLIFVAFDGKELSLSGSSFFVKHLEIPKSKVTCAVNIDMIGANFDPPRRNQEYVIVLGESSLPQSFRGFINYLCTRSQYRMDVDLSFYGSKDFTKFVYEGGDQYPFRKAGIPAVLFTSAFNKHTYKTSDKVDIINFPLMFKRTLVIFNFINRLCQDN